MVCNTSIELSIKKDIFGLLAILRGIFSFLMVSSLFIATTGFFETFIGYLFLGSNPNISVCIVGFLVAFATYNLDKIGDSKEDAINMPERSNFVSKHRRKLLLLTPMAYLFSVLIMALIEPLATPIVFVPVVAGLIYSSRLVQGYPRIKDIPVIKSLVVAFSWASICVLLPVTTIKGITEITIASVFYFILVKVFIDAVLFDIRDLKGDRENGVRTIPVLIGAQKTTMILLVINSTLLPCIALIDHSIRPLAALMTLYGYVYILYFRKRRSPIALDFFVDGQWMLASIVFIVLKNANVLI